MNKQTQTGQRVLICRAYKYHIIYHSQCYVIEIYQTERASNIAFNLMGLIKRQTLNFTMFTCLLQQNSFYYHEIPSKLLISVSTFP